MDPTPNPDLPTAGAAHSSSGPICLDEAPAEETGWVELVNRSGEHGVLADGVVDHDRGQRVDVELTHRGGNEYELCLATESVRAGNAPADARPTATPDLAPVGCDVGTHIEISGTARTPIEVLAVSVDGQPVARFEMTEAGSAHLSFPTPVNADG